MGFIPPAPVVVVDTGTEAPQITGNTFTAATTHKTKAQIVARLQEAEADAWLEIVSYDCGRAPISCTDRERLRWEESDPERRVLMAAWYSLRVLMEELEIHTAKNLPQHVAAKALSAELDSRRAMGSPGTAFTIKS